MANTIQVCRRGSRPRPSLSEADASPHDAQGTSVAGVHAPAFVERL